MTISPEKAVQTLTKQYARQNEYIKNNYDRISVTFQKGTKERIKATGAKSINSFIIEAVEKELKNIEG